MTKKIKDTAAGTLLCMLILAAMVVTTLLLAGCTTTDMDINKIGAEEKIVVYCFPDTESDTTCITVMRSVPSTNYEPETTCGAKTEELRLPNANVTFLLNGVEQEVKYATEQTGSVSAGTFFVVCPIATGDRIEVTATADGLPQASAETTVPACKVVKATRTTTVIHDQTNYKQLLIDIDGTIMRDGYYAVTVSKAYTLTGVDYTGEPLTATYDYRMSVDMIDEPLISPAGSDVDLFDFDDYFHDDFYIFNGGNVTSDTYTLRLNLIDGWYIDTSDFKSGRIENPRYIVRIYRIDEALYRFLKSINDMTENSWGRYGLAPVLPTYSNISGGLGVVGGCGVEKAEIAEEFDEYEFQYSDHIRQ